MQSEPSSPFYPPPSNIRISHRLDPSVCTRGLREALLHWRNCKVSVISKNNFGQGVFGRGYSLGAFCWPRGMGAVDRCRPWRVGAVCRSPRQLLQQSVGAVGGEPTAGARGELEDLVRHISFTVYLRTLSPIYFLLPPSILSSSSRSE